MQKIKRAIEIIQAAERELQTRQRKARENKARDNKARKKKFKKLKILKNIENERKMGRDEI